MNPTSLQDLTREQLDRAVDLYSRVGLAIPAGLTNKAKIAAFLEELATTAGKVYEGITADDVIVVPPPGSIAPAYSDKVIPATQDQGTAPADAVVPDTTQLTPPSSNTVQAPPSVPDQGTVDTEGIPADAVSVAVSFIDPNVGTTDRVFSKDVHGDNFRQIADQFAEKVSGTVHAV